MLVCLLLAEPEAEADPGIFERTVEYRQSFDLDVVLASLELKSGDPDTMLWAHDVYPGKPKHSPEVPPAKAPDPLTDWADAPAPGSRGASANSLYSGSMQKPTTN